MRKEFEPVFDELFRNYGKRVPEPYPGPFDLQPEDIRSAIERAREDLTKTVRPDALYFLLLNFHQMVVVPMQFMAPNAFNELRKKDVVDDLREILRFAESVSDDEHVSANDVLAATALVRHKLKIDSLEIWG